MSAPEKISSCKVAVRLLVSKGEYRRSWKAIPVAEAIAGASTEIRCPDGHGAVRLHGKNVEHGPDLRTTTQAVASLALGINGLVEIVRSHQPRIDHVEDQAA